MFDRFASQRRPSGFTYIIIVVVVSLSKTDSSFILSLLNDIALLYSVLSISLCFNSSFCLLVKVMDFVCVGTTQFLQLDIAVLIGINKVPDLADILASKRYSHALNRIKEVLLTHFALSTLIHKSKDFSYASMFFLHTS